jgi:hypothetical protein
MAHGYLHDYDERWDRSEDRDRVERDWREASERNRHFMFDRDRGWRGTGDDEWREGRSAFTSRGDWERAPRNFSSRQDDHYRSWRDRQMDALDRDYADYCRERERQFHHDFDTWRSNRGNNPGPLRTGMAQTGQSHDPTGMLELTNEATDNAEPDVDPMDTATLGTNSSSGKGR